MLIYKASKYPKDFPGSSGDNESFCNAGDPSWIPESGSSPGERIGYPLQYSWIPLMAQWETNPPKMEKLYTVSKNKTRTNSD